jgi:biopolymer transport protein ExbB
MPIEILKLVSEGGVVSISVAAILLAMSMGSWTLMVVKTVQLRSLKKNNAAFAAGLVPNHHQHSLLGKVPPELGCGVIFDKASIDATLKAVLNAKRNPKFSPYARLTVQALSASEQHCRLAREVSDTTRNRDDYIAQSLNRMIGNEAVQLENGLTLLASIGSIAPFVGLFGTVWGIYHALGAIAVGGQVTVDKVAGPVGEALIMTAFGLAVAMPAVLAYNAFLRDNRLLIAEMENFAHDLYASLTIGVAHSAKPGVKAGASKQTMAVVS